MIHSKNSHGVGGFTLIEALMAITILALIITPLFILQGSILRNVTYFSQRLRRVFLAKNFLFEMRIEAEKQQAEQAFALEKKIDEPLTQLAYKREKLSKKSALSSLEDLYVERVTATWEQQGQQLTQEIVSIVHKKPKPKEEKKEKKDEEETT